MKTLLKSSIQQRRGWPVLMVLLALLCRPAFGQTLITNFSQFKTALSTAPIIKGSRVITNFWTNITINVMTSGGTFDIATNVTIDGGTNGVVFQGTQTQRLFNVHTNCQLILNNLQVIDFASTNGGAISNQGTLIISNCIFGGNAATNISGTNGTTTSSSGDGESGTSGGTAEGGAIYSTGPVRIYFSVFGTNTAEGGNGGSGAAGEPGLIFGGLGGAGGAGGGAYGAAVFSTGSNNVFFATEFFNNVCTAGAAGSGGAAGGGAGFFTPGGAGAAGGWAAGGAVFVSGALFMSNCVFGQNTITAGAAGSDYSENVAPNGGTAEGGGVFISTVVSNAYLENCVFFANTCTGGGGGVSMSESGGNGGSALGGGLASGAQLTQVRNCTLATNTLVAGTNGTGTGSGSAGGIDGFDIMRGAGVIDLSGSILSGGTNAVDEIVPTDPDAYGITDAGYNISSDNSLARVFTTTLIETDPILDSGLAGYGGPNLGPSNLVTEPETLTLAILGGSPAANFIPGVPGLTFPATDELGMARGSPTSAGAYEINPITLDSNALLQFPTVTLATNEYFVSAGGMVTLEVTNVTWSDTNNPLGYQWQFKGTNLSDNSMYIGATSSNLTVKDIGPAEEGSNYQVVVGVSTLEGVTTSAIVSITIKVKPAITLQPVGKTVSPGSVVTFSVAATGAESYQWLKNKVAITDTNEFPGATTPALTFNPVTSADEGSYSVLVANQYGTATSAVAVLTVVADTKPLVAFSASPAANARTNNPVFTGTATDKAQVVAVNYWITNVNDGRITVTSDGASLGAGTTARTWSISNGFLPGTNYVTVQSVNYSGGNSTLVTREFFYVAPALFALNTTGNGTVTGTASVAGVLPANNAMLNIGEGYTLTAKPANANYVLTNWTGSNALTGAFTSNALTLHFIMESNETITATFTTNLFNGAMGTYNGLFYGSNVMDISNVTEQTAGMLSGLTVSASGVYSGRLLLNGATLTLAAGSFDTSGSATNLVPRTAAQGGPVTVEMYLTWTGGQIGGAVSGTNEGGWSSVLYAEKAVTKSTSNEYTVLLAPGTTNSVGEIPPGFGYILITNHDGAVNLTSGALADGSTFNQTVQLGVSNEVPVFYGKLYTSTGLLLGWLGLSNGTVTEETPMVWIKAATHSGFYTNAFTNLLLVTGSGWTNPPLHKSADSMSGGTLTISNSSLDLNFDVSITTNNAVVKATNSLPTNSLTGTITPATGLLTITFGNGNGKATTVGQGVILQNSTNAGLTNGGGYFTNAGLILLIPPPQ